MLFLYKKLLEVDASYNPMISFTFRAKYLCFFEGVVLGINPASQEITDQDPRTAL